MRRRRPIAESLARAVAYRAPPGAEERSSLRAQRTCSPDRVRTRLLSSVARGLCARPDNAHAWQRIVGGCTNVLVLGESGELGLEIWAGYFCSCFITLSVYEYWVLQLLCLLLLGHNYGLGDPLELNLGYGRYFVGLHQTFISAARDAIFRCDWRLGCVDIVASCILLGRQCSRIFACFRRLFLLGKPMHEISSGGSHGFTVLVLVVTFHFHQSLDSYLHVVHQYGHEMRAL
ncbi:aflatoxin B1 aldehyde reductase member 2, partial [Striga asiatica]